MKNLKSFEEFVNESKSADKYPSFEVSKKGVRRHDMLISVGYWSYMGKERYGKGLYMNINNRQTYGFSTDDIDFLRNQSDVEVY